MGLFCTRPVCLICTATRCYGRAVRNSQPEIRACAAMSVPGVFQVPGAVPSSPVLLLSLSTGRQRTANLEGAGNDIFLRHRGFPPHCRFIANIVSVSFLQPLSCSRGGFSHVSYVLRPLCRQAAVSNAKSCSCCCSHWTPGYVSSIRRSGSFCLRVVSWAPPPSVTCWLHWEMVAQGTDLHCSRGGDLRLELCEY